MADEKTCFVVMGFEIKTAPEDNRKLDLNKTYEFLIKPAIVAAGLKSVRADKTHNSGSISREMFEYLMEADVVVGDLSTANVNAYYEVGIRHALNPAATVLIAEKNHKIPFDLKDITILKYDHLGPDIGASTVASFVPLLTKQIEEALKNGEAQADSPVYTFLHDLIPPVFGQHVHDASAAVRTFGVAGSPGGFPGSSAEEPENAGPDEPEAPAPDPTDNQGFLAQSGEEAMEAEDFSTATKFFRAAHALDPDNDYLIQRLTLACYQAKQPDALTALNEARDILSKLDPPTSADPETLGLWGAIHKKIWEQTGEVETLQTATSSYERGFYMKRDYYNGINFAYLLNVRCNETGGSDGVADFVGAQRVRRQVIDICLDLKAQASFDDRGDDRYWIAATLVEAYAGLEDTAAEDAAREDSKLYASKDWMAGSTDGQVAKLKQLLVDTPAEVKAVVEAE